MTHRPVPTFVPISDLNVNFTHAKVVGVVIGKTDSRGFPDRKNIGSERFTFGFTIKDSPAHFINVSSWGNEGYIQALSNCFQTGDCVVIENPLVMTKDCEKEERFWPSTTSLYKLLITEAHSSIGICSDSETEARLLPLFHMPTKESNNFYSLGDITANGQSLHGKIISILAAVQMVGEEKFFSKSDGRSGQRMEMQLFDDTEISFTLLCWEKESIRMLQSLTQRGTDARTTFDSYRKCMTATVTSKTIITINPVTAEASQLYNSVREILESGRLDDQDLLCGDVGQLDSVSDILTLNQLESRCREHANVFCCITFGFITSLELCSSISKVIRNRCQKCKFLVPEESQTCPNAACPSQGQNLQVSAGLDLLVDVSDHTGTLPSCSLASTVAEKMLNCKMEEFLSLSDSQKISLKWKFLLERCKIYLKITPSSKSRSGIRASILSCVLADPVEVKQGLAANAI